MSIKALAQAVLERNRPRNKPATEQETECNKTPMQGEPRATELHTRLRAAADGLPVTLAELLEYLSDDLDDVERMDVVTLRVIAITFCGVLNRAVPYPVEVK